MTAYLNAVGLNCALGANKEEIAVRLFAGHRGGVRQIPGEQPGTAWRVAPVSTALPPVPPALAEHDSRNNRLLLQAASQIETELRQAVERYGRHRVAVIIGTSTSGIGDTREAFLTLRAEGHLPPAFRYGQQLLEAPAACLAAWLGVSGPAYVISTACTSSARALLSAQRLLKLGLCDAVVCGGADSLCALTLNGFGALGAISDAPSNPFSRNRDGINIGEAAVVFLMTREAPDNGLPMALLGGGATSDAYHISAPDPSGRGAIKAMQTALVAAGLQPSQLGYLNLHGTATVHNDAMESQAVASIFPAGIACSSTKPMTGHTLGAAGALEAAFCWLSLQQGQSPPHLWDGEQDETLPALTLNATATALRQPFVMSNSFAFGGNNVSLILGVKP